MTGTLTGTFAGTLTASVISTQTQPQPRPPTPTPWLPFGPQPGAVRLYCLPHAGGSASVYRHWFGKIEGVAVCPVQPPARETRLRDKPLFHMEQLVPDLADAILSRETGPYAVYGHSLGALVGFELLREIRRRGGPQPEHLFVSASPAPGIDPDAGSRPVSGMDDDEVVELLRGLGGTPDWMLKDPAVVRMILPPFRADFSVKDTYEYRQEPPLSVPITSIAATDDPRVAAAAMAGWREETSGRFRSYLVAGGHFAPVGADSEVPGLIGRILAGSRWVGVAS